MSEPSLAQPAQPTTPKELLADRVEIELSRLRAARPHLEDRIDRASTILLHQLTSPPRQRPIRCRISRALGPKFLIRSSRDRGATYVINPKIWRCSCPDVHRTGCKGCKHVLASYVLWRLAADSERPCACIDGYVYIGHTELVNADTGEVVETVDRIPCRRCSVPA